MLEKTKKLKKYVPLILFFIFVLSINAHAGGKITLPQAWKEFMDEYRMMLAYFSGFGVLTSILVGIILMLKLATMPNHPIQRRNCIAGIITSFICMSLLGGISLILTLFYTIIFIG